jgi:hypothetical protein
VEISCRVYRPRRPRDSPLFQLVERHLEELLRVWPTRFARPHGPLRPVVQRVLREFLIAFVTDQMAIGKILDHLGLSNPQAAKPPPPAREVLRVAEHADGWGSPQQWDPA